MSHTFISYGRKADGVGGVQRGGATIRRGIVPLQVSKVGDRKGVVMEKVREGKSEKVTINFVCWGDACVSKSGSVEDGLTKGKKEKVNGVRGKRVSPKETRAVRVRCLQMGVEGA